MIPPPPPPVSLAEFDYFSLPDPVKPKPQTLAQVLEQGEYTAKELKSALPPGWAVFRHAVDSVLGADVVCVLFANMNTRAMDLVSKCALQVWRLDDLEHPHTLAPETATPMFGLSLDGDHLALVHNRATVRVYDVSSGITLVREYTPPEGTERSGAYARSALSEQLVAATDGNRQELVMWARDTGTLLRAFSAAYSVSALRTTLKFTGKRLIFSGPGQGITLFNTVTGQQDTLDVNAPILDAEFVSPTRLAVLWDRKAGQGPSKHRGIVCSV